MKTARAFISWLLSPLLAVLAIFGVLYEKHRFARRFTLHWSQALITYSVWKFWQNLSHMGEWQSAIIVAIIGLQTISIGLYQWDAAREDK